MIDERTLNLLLDRLGWLEAHAVTREYGVVTDDSPLAIAIGSSDTSITNVARVASYTPVVDERVLVLKVGSDYIVIGETTT